MKQRACPVSGARANNEQRPMECSEARSAGGDHTWSQLCFIKRQRSRESQRTLTGVPPQRSPRRSQDVAVGPLRSAQRALLNGPPANGVDGCRQRRRGTPFGSAKRCRFFADCGIRRRGAPLHTGDTGHSARSEKTIQTSNYKPGTCLFRCHDSSMASSHGLVTSLSQLTSSQ